jgi:transposase
MPWNEADRERYNIVRERYTSDLSDEEYALIEPLLPQPKRRGRKPTPARTILNAIFYLARCACPWRYMPAARGGSPVSCPAKYGDRQRKVVECCSI